MYLKLYCTWYCTQYWTPKCTLKCTLYSTLYCQICVSAEPTEDYPVLPISPHFPGWTLGLGLSHYQWLRLGYNGQVLSNYLSSEHRLWLNYQTEIIHTNIWEHFQPDTKQIVTFVGYWHSCMHQIDLQLNLWKYFFKGISIHSTETKLAFKIRRRKKPSVFSTCRPLLSDVKISR